MHTWQKITTKTCISIFAQIMSIKEKVFIYLLLT